MPPSTAPAPLDSPFFSMGITSVTVPQLPHTLGTGAGAGAGAAATGGGALGS